jgi:hypothetical protein
MDTAMTDNLYAPPTSDLTTIPGSEAAHFYVTSQKKLIVLFICTFGLYMMFWYYKNWRAYKNANPSDDDAQSVWPVPRAIFPVFFTHSLFSKVKDHAPDNELVAQWEEGTNATLIVVLLIASNILSRMAGETVGILDLLSVLLLAPLLFLFMHAQRMINASCNDPQGAQNSNFTIANYCWCAVGGALIVLVIVGAMLPEVGPQE